MKAVKITLGVAALIILGIIGFLIFHPAKTTQAHLSQDQTFPNDCQNIQRSFPASGISFYDKSCPGINASDSWTYWESSNTEIMRSSNGRVILTMQLYSKDASETPMAVMNNFYNQLTPTEQQDCSIQNGDGGENGVTDDFSSLATTTNILTYTISPKPQLDQKIINKYGGLPPEPNYDYLCGRKYGSPFQISSPFFEFISSTPNKYLEVENLPNDGSMLIDLNSIRF